MSAVGNAVATVIRSERRQSWRSFIEIACVPMALRRVPIPFRKAPPDVEDGDSVHRLRLVIEAATLNA